MNLSLLQHVSVDPQLQGGIRAVVWTDVVQILLVLGAALAVLVKGATDVGGWATVWAVASHGSRLPDFE